MSGVEKAGFFEAVGEASEKAIWCAPASVDVQFLVSPPDFVHILCRGRAEIIRDPGEKKRAWDVIDYDLSQFWRGR